MTSVDAPEWLPDRVDRISPKADYALGKLDESVPPATEQQIWVLWWMLDSDHEPLKDGVGRARTFLNGVITECREAQRRTTDDDVMAVLVEIYEDVSELNNDLADYAYDVRAEREEVDDE